MNLSNDLTNDLFMLSKLKIHSSTTGTLCIPGIPLYSMINSSETMVAQLGMHNCYQTMCFVLFFKSKSIYFRRLRAKPLNCP